MIVLTQPLFLILIGTCFVLSIKNQDRQPLKTLLPIFFAILFLVESICYYLKTIKINNLVIYNLWFPIEFMFYSYWVTAYYDSKGFKRIFHFLIPFYATVVFVIYVFSDSLLKFNSVAFQLGFLLLLPVLLFKLYENVNQSTIENPIKNPIFWLITGLLISYVFSLSEFSIQNYLHSNDKDLLEALKKVNIFLTDVLYITIIVYFILKWKTEKLPI